MEILLKELDPGQKYIFQARAKSATGKLSPWSTAFEHTTTSDTIAPSPVTSLTWDVVGTSFSATWVKPLTDSNGKPLKDFRDYKITLTADSTDVVYFVTQERFDLTFEANRNAFGTAQPVVQISVQVRDLTGNLSTTVTDTATNPVPADVTGFTAQGISNGVALSWDSVTADDLKWYEVYVSTSGAGFTPGPTNLVFTGAGTNFVYSSTNYVPHYFKIRAVDVFGQGSANYASASASPQSSSGIDLTPPDDPTGVAVSTSTGVDGSAILEVSWTAVGSSNLSDYIVRYSTDEVAWIYVSVPAGQVDATINGVDPDTNYYVQVAAMSYANVKSDFVNATPYPITSAADTSAPSQPAAPTVSTSTLAVQVSHDMTKQGGGDLEADVQYLEIHASTTTGFTPSNATLRGTIDTAGVGIDVSGVFYFPTTDSITNLYWKVIAVDRAKNKSTASNQTTGTPGLILNANIANATITSAKINDLEANKITAGTGIINNLAIKSTLTIDTAGFLQSSNWNGSSTGYRLDTSGLTIYNGSISAAALLLQDSANIVGPAFADWEFNEDYYHSGGTINTNIWSSTGTGVAVDIVETDRRFGNKCLRAFNGAITNPTVHNFILAPGGFVVDGNGIDIDPGDYIVSFYAKKNGTPNQNMVFGFYTDAGGFVFSSTFNVTSTSWTRYSGVVTVPSGVSKAKPYFNIGPQAANTGYDVLIDGIQIERKNTGSSTPSLWRPPSKTTIDGSQVVTGSIRSSAPSSTDPTQPAWSINTAGNMQIGDALVRGSITVGPTTTKVNLMPEQFASFEEASSYYHNGSNVPFDSNFDAYPVSNTTSRVQILTDPMFGTQGLRAFDTSLPTSGNGAGIAFSNNYTNAAGNNIQVIPGESYIVSGYFKNNAPAKNLTIQFSAYMDDANWNFIGTAANISANTTYTRVYGAFTVPAGKTTLQIILWVVPTGGSNGFDIIMDGLQLEKLQPGQTTPSDWTIDVDDLSYVRSGNYSPGFSGWNIANDGSVEFNDGLFRGRVNVDSTFGGADSEVSLYSAPSVWKAFNFPVQTQIEGITPTIRFEGTAFKTAIDGTNTAGDPYQVVFRGTPEGGYQLMFDGTNTDKIFRIDGNYLSNESYGVEDSFYGFSDLRAGRGYNRQWASATTNGYVDRNNIYYSQLETSTKTKSPMLSGHNTGIWSLNESSYASYDFRPFASTKMYSSSRINMTSQNIIPDGWDLFDVAAATLNSGSTKNRVTVGTVRTDITSFSASPVDAWTGIGSTISGLNLTLTLAGSGNHQILLSSSATTYNVTVEPGCEYSMSFQFGLRDSLIGKQIQYVMKLSNGTLLTSTAHTITADDSWDDVTTVEAISMTGTNTFVIPAGITSCLVGFQLLGGVSADTGISITAGHLYKTREADGTYASSYVPLLRNQRGATYNLGESAEVWVTSGTQDQGTATLSDPNIQWGSKVRLLAQRNNYATSTVDSAQLTVNPDKIIVEGAYVWLHGENWIQPTLSNSWSHSSSSWGPVQYRLLPQGEVVMRGLATHPDDSGSGGTKGVNVLMFTLPVGYRPTVDLQMFGSGDANNSTNPIVQILANGQVSVARGGLFQFFNGIRFLVT